MTPKLFKNTKYSVKIQKWQIKEHNPVDKILKIMPSFRVAHQK